MRVLITGSNGQLGSEFKELAANYKKFDFVFKDLPELDICNFEALQAFVIDYDINIVINCIKLKPKHFMKSINFQHIIR